MQDMQIQCSFGFDAIGMLKLSSNLHRVSAQKTILGISHDIKTFLSAYSEQRKQQNCEILVPKDSKEGGWRGQRIF